MAAQIFNMPSPPLVVSISYGGDEIYSYINFNGSCLSFACAQNSINRFVPQPTFFFKKIYILTL